MSEKTTDLVCIVCPRGCRLKVTEDNGNYTVTGNQCKRGIDYGVKELTNPTRVITTTVMMTDSSLRRLPVVTKGDIPKPLIFEAMKEINKVRVKAPVKVGDILIEDLLGTGVNVVASRSVIE